MNAVAESFTPDEALTMVQSSLLDIGPRKPLGYMPLSTLAKCNVSVSYMEQKLLSRGLFVERITGGCVDGGAGALFAADLESLDALIVSRMGVCLSMGWPILARDFVRKVASTWVPEEEYPELHELIGRAFGDKRFQ